MIIKPYSLKHLIHFAQLGKLQTQNKREHGVLHIVPESSRFTMFLTYLCTTPMVGHFGSPVVK
jgi:hypothetical protein